MFPSNWNTLVFMEKNREISKLFNYIRPVVFRLWYLRFYYNLSLENNVDTSSEFIFIYLGHVYACLTPFLFDLNDCYCQYRGRMVVTRAFSAYHH
jgi:hypothetical protein